MFCRLWHDDPVDVSSRRFLRLRVLPALFCCHEMVNTLLCIDPLCGSLSRSRYLLCHIDSESEQVKGHIS